MKKLACIKLNRQTPCSPRSAAIAIWVLAVCLFSFLPNQAQAFYNPQTGHWLSREPLGENASLNAYQMANNNLMQSVDVLGLYEVDVHRYLTIYLAQNAGFDALTADRIGRETQALDDSGDLRDAMEGGVNHSNMEKYHFVSKEQLAKLRAKALCSCDMRAIGEYLHALEDTYAHSTGVEDRNWDYYDGPITTTVHVPEIAVAGHKVINRHELKVAESANIGHGAYGHKPDWTWKYQKKSMRMAETVYSELQGIASHCKNAKNAPKDFDTLRRRLQEFIEFSPETYIHRTMKVAPVENADFDGYEAKIKILDSSFSLEKDSQQFPLPIPSQEPDYSNVFLRKPTDGVPNYFK